MEVYRICPSLSVAWRRFARRCIACSCTMQSRCVEGLFLFFCFVPLFQCFLVKFYVHCFFDPWSSPVWALGWYGHGNCQRRCFAHLRGENSSFFPLSISVLGNPCSPSEACWGCHLESWSRVHWEDLSLCTAEQNGTTKWISFCSFSESFHCPSPLSVPSQF